MRFVRHLPTLVAALCVLAWLPWVLGVPGVEGTGYARGWTIGLYAILLYPLAILAIAVVSFILSRSGMAATTLAQALRFLALAAFGAAQALAWSIML